MQKSNSLTNFLTLLISTIETKRKNHESAIVTHHYDRLISRLAISCKFL
jgi:hypothetical protein